MAAQQVRRVLPGEPAERADGGGARRLRGRLPRQGVPDGERALPPGVPRQPQALPAAAAAARPLQNGRARPQPRRQDDARLSARPQVQRQGRHLLH